MTIHNGTVSEQESNRLIGIDATRGLAVLFMVFSHGLHWLYTGTSHELLQFFGSLSLGDMATPVFFTLGGLSLYLSVTAQMRKGAGLSELVLRFRKRFSQLFFIGVCLSLLWGVLQVQALVLFTVVSVFLFCLSRYDTERSRKIVFYAALVCLVVHQLLVLSFDYSPYLIIFRGQFPFFAVVGMSGIGFFSSVLLKFRLRNVYFLLFGASLTALSQLLHINGVALKRFDAPASFIILGLGLSFTCIGLLNSVLIRDSIVIRYLSYVGRDALFLFVFHHVALFLPVYLLGFYNKLGPLPALLTSASFIVIVLITAKRRMQSSFSVYQLTDKLFSMVYTFTLQIIFSVNRFFSSICSFLYSMQSGKNVKT